MKPMKDAPRDRPFLVRFTARLGGDVAFCRFRQDGQFRAKLDNPDFARWDVDGPVYFRDDAFKGWTDLPEGFENVRFKDDRLMREDA